MLAFLKRNIFLVLIFFITLSVGFLTFLTFIDKSIIELNDQNHSGDYWHVEIEGLGV